MRLLQLNILLLMVCVAAAQHPARRVDASYMVRHLAFSRYELSGTGLAFQDSRGIVWFDAASGAQSYDGSVFRNFPYGKSDPAQCPVKYITAFEEDDKGRLWLCGEEGIAVYDPEKERFFSQREIFAGNRELPAFTISMVRDADKRIWFYDTGGNLYLYDPQKGEASLHTEGFVNRISAHGNRINSWSADEEGRIWIAHNRGISAFNTTTGEVTSEFPAQMDLLNRYRNTQVSHVLYDRFEKAVWFICRDRMLLVKFIPATGGHVSYSFSGSLNVHLNSEEGNIRMGGTTTDSEGNVWITTNSDYLIRIRRPNQEVEYFLSMPAEEGSFSGSKEGDMGFPVIGKMQPGHPEVWIASRLGMNIIPLKPMRITHHYFPYSVTGGSSMLEFSSLQQLPGGGYIGLTSGRSHPAIYIFDRNFNVIRTLMDESNRQENVTWFFPENTEDGIYVFTYPANRSRKSDPLHAISREFILDPATLTLKPVQLDYFQRIARAGSRDAKGNRWYYFNDRCYATTAAGSLIDSFTIGRGDTVVAYRFVQALHRESNTFWVSFFDKKEVIQIDLLSRRVVRTFSPDPDDPSSLHTGQVFAISSLDRDHVLVKSQRDIDIVNVRNGSIRHVTNYADLDHFSFAVQLHSGRLWVAGVSAIAEIDLETGRARILEQGKDFRMPLYSGIYRLPPPENGRMVFAGPNGILSFHVDSVFLRPPPRPLKVTSVRLENVYLPVDSIIKHGFSLSYGSHQDLTVGFSDFGFHHPEGIRYEYALYAGGDTAWQQAGDQPVLSFRHLAPGRYRLLLRSNDKTGAVSPVLEAMKIRVMPPLWRAPWFLAVLVLAILVGGIVLMRYRMDRFRERTAREHDNFRKMAELEMQSLRSQLNPHFMFNSLNAIQELILRDEMDKSHSYLARFSRLLRMLIDNADQQYVSLQQEIDFLHLYLSLEKLRINDLQYSINASGISSRDAIMIPNMILQPFIENALWHGLSPSEREKILRIDMTQQEHLVSFVIEDNGIGRERSEARKSVLRPGHRSRGVELLTRRFSLLNSQYGTAIRIHIEDIPENGEVSGTRVIITVPAKFSFTEKAKHDKNYHY